MTAALAPRLLKPAQQPSADARWADIAAVQRRIEDEALTHVRQALDRPDLPITFNISVGNRRSSRAG